MALIFVRTHVYTSRKKKKQKQSSHSRVELSKELEVTSGSKREETNGIQSKEGPQSSEEKWQALMGLDSYGGNKKEKGIRRIKKLKKRVVRKVLAFQMPSNQSN